MSVKRLNIADVATAEEVWSLQHAAYRVEAERIGVADLPPLRDTVGTLRSCRETFYGLHTKDGELAGVVSTEQEPGNRVVICRMMVRPDYFRQGIGSRLLQHVLSLAPAGTELRVTAEIRNIPAVRLYERLGFTAVETFQPAARITMVRLSRLVLNPD